MKRNASQTPFWSVKEIRDDRLEISMMMQIDEMTDYAMGMGSERPKEDYPVNSLILTAQDSDEYIESVVIHETLADTVKLNVTFKNAVENPVKDRILTKAQDLKLCPLSRNNRYMLPITSDTIHQARDLILTLDAYASFGTERIKIFKMLGQKAPTPPSSLVETCARFIALHPMISTENSTKVLPGEAVDAINNVLKP